MFDEATLTFEARVSISSLTDMLGLFVAAMLGLFALALFGVLTPLTGLVVLFLSGMILTGSRFDLSWSIEEEQ